MAWGLLFPLKPTKRGTQKTTDPCVLCVPCIGGNNKELRNTYGLRFSHNCHQVAGVWSYQLLRNYSSRYERYTPVMLNPENTLKFALPAPKSTREQVLPILQVFIDAGDVPGKAGAPPGVVGAHTPGTGSKTSMRNLPGGLYHHGYKPASSYSPAMVVFQVSGHYNSQTANKEGHSEGEFVYTR